VVHSNSETDRGVTIFQHRDQGKNSRGRYWCRKNTSAHPTYLPIPPWPYPHFTQKPLLCKTTK